MEISYILTGIAVMAGVTYLIRMIPMVFFRKKIENVWLQSFLYYVPYAVLTAMTFPAVFSSTGSTLSAVIGCAAALILAFFNRSLLIVAVGAAAAALITQFLGF
ncbi:MAG: AzlD domain-containing protein [Clostridia bacterium]|nr:AzlD domain-containing protein [Clostridia bacterium]